MDTLRAFIVSTEFQDRVEEIRFFKVWKPRFYSQLIYFLRVLRIESRKPFGNKREIESYYAKQQNIINYFVENNLSFYQYCRVGAEHLDEQYFVRNHLFIPADVDHVYFNGDPRFSSLMDYTMAKLQANEMLSVYLENCIARLNKTTEPATDYAGRELPKLSWTASKTALIELIYALHENGVFNGANADIKQIAVLFEHVFSVDLGNYYRVFQDIRIRKKSRTVFLDHLKEVLEKRMDEEDEHPRFQK